MTGWWLATDCEGPLSLNDYAFELCGAYIPEGERLFEVLSVYDDYLTAVERRPGHPAGSTLRWVAPFLKAFGLSEPAARAYAARHLVLVPGVVRVLGILKDIMPVFIISASYLQYLEALCGTVGLPAECARATPFPIDGYPMKAEERERLKEMAGELAALSPPEWPAGAAGVEDLERAQRQTISRLQKALEEIGTMEAAKLMGAVTVVGGLGKAEALRQIVPRPGTGPGDAMYIGDSITDVEALTLVREAGGIAVAFNANRYALEAAEIACLSPHAGPILALAAVFSRNGPQGVRRLVEAWPAVETILQLFPPEAAALWEAEWEQSPGEVVFTSGQERDRLVARSEDFRRQVRGQAIGSLG